MFEQPNVEDSVWKDQKGRYGLAKRMLRMVGLAYPNESLWTRSGSTYLWRTGYHTRRPYRLRLSSLGESLPSVLDAYAVAVSSVSGAKTRVCTPAPGESKAQNGLPDSTLSSEPKPLM
nr:hypothetical protein [Tanacetum cinerariifolium]